MADHTSLLDLFARVLNNGVEHLIRRGLDRDYVSHTEVTAGVRGRIRLADSLKSLTIPQARLCCEFDDFRYDVVHNQIVKSTLRTLSRCELVEAETRHALHLTHRRLPEVADINVTDQVFRTVRLHRNNRFYRFLLEVCRIIANNLPEISIPTAGSETTRWTLWQLLRAQDAPNRHQIATSACLLALLILGTNAVWGLTGNANDTLVSAWLNGIAPLWSWVALIGLILAGFVTAAVARSRRGQHTLALIIAANLIGVFVSEVIRGRIATAGSLPLDTYGEAMQVALGRTTLLIPIVPMLLVVVLTGGRWKYLSAPLRDPAVGRREDASMSQVGFTFLAMPLEPGTTLGPYAVTAKIGEGGMGEVYRARDTKLDRDVALKVLP